MAEMAQGWSGGEGGDEASDQAGVGVRVGARGAEARPPARPRCLGADVRAVKTPRGCAGRRSGGGGRAGGRTGRPAFTVTSTLGVQYG